MEPKDSNGKLYCDEFIKPKINKNCNSGKNLWILKPTSLNRGIGIHVFSNIE